MAVQLFNTRTKTIESLTPMESGVVKIYSCGPTVYDHVHIGNLSAFIAADTLRRVVATTGVRVLHAMNFTDVDDKTIRRSQRDHPNEDPNSALRKTTEHYSELFLDDCQKIGIDTSAITFVKATDPATIQGMKELVVDLYSCGIAYIADDGVYFSIEAYKNAGRTYGQLVEVTIDTTANPRIQNDEYDKEQAHDFALWKKQKTGEPAWEFTLDGTDLTGRPGWHLECSVMSKNTLGQPFDIHTGGIDLAFPHHENEIAQSTATSHDPLYANIFFHNEHVLVDGKKMSKSLGNFYTLSALEAHGVDPLAFRLLVLQSHYRKQTNFSFKSATAAQQRLHNWRRASVLRHQIHATAEQTQGEIPSRAAIDVLNEILQLDIDTPRALAHIDQVLGQVLEAPLHMLNRQALSDFITHVDTVLGIELATTTPDISDEQKQTIQARKQARASKDWAMSDQLREQLLADGIAMRDTPHNTIWEYA